MRTKCACGAKACYWYGPSVSEAYGSEKLAIKEYLAYKCYCSECANTENWSEYWYIGYHKRKWQWLKIGKLRGICK